VGWGGWWGAVVGLLGGGAIKWLQVGGVIGDRHEQMYSEYL
jgi:hypothetical protein